MPQCSSPTENVPAAQSGAHVAIDVADTALELRPTGQAIRMPLPGQKYPAAHGSVALGGRFFGILPAAGIKHVAEVVAVVTVEYFPLNN